MSDPSGKVSSWVHHECWDHSTTLVYSKGYDVMILRVEGMDFDEPIRLVEPTAYETFTLADHPTNEYLTSYGFGDTALGFFGGIPSQLKKTLPTQFVRCDSLTTFDNRPDIMCYETVSSQTVYRGDSGGPRIQNKVQFSLVSGFYWPNQLESMQNGNLDMSSVLTPTGDGEFSLRGGLSVDTAIGHYYTWIRGNSNYDPSGVFFGDAVTKCDIDLNIFNSICSNKLSNFSSLQT